MDTESQAPTSTDARSLGNGLASTLRHRGTVRKSVAYEYHKGRSVRIREARPADIMGSELRKPGIFRGNTSRSCDSWKFKALVFASSRFKVENIY